MIESMTVKVINLMVVDSCAIYNKKIAIHNINIYNCLNLDEN